MDLEAGEQVIFEGHPSWRSTLGFYLKGLVVVAVAGALAAAVTAIAAGHVQGGWVALAAVAMLAVVLVAGYLRRMATTYTITTRRLVIRRGILSRAEQHSRVERIQNVSTSQSLLQRILGVGSVDFDTAAGEDDELRFTGVADPHGVVEAVRVAQERSPSVEARTG